jgi:hypothetical protein
VNCGNPHKGLLTAGMGACSRRSGSVAVGQNHIFANPSILGSGPGTLLRGPLRDRGYYPPRRGARVDGARLRNSGSSECSVAWFQIRDRRAPLDEALGVSGGS